MAFFASRADDLIEDEFEEDAREPLLPDSWSAALRRRAAELAGLALAAMAAALALALGSYDPADPSFFNATSTPPSNWLGLPGATLADPAVRTLGLGAWATAGVLGAWGLRLILHAGEGRVWSRLVLSPVAVLATSACLSAHVPPEGWSAEFGLGGAMGDSIAAWAYGALPFAGVAGAAPFSLTLTLVAALAFAGACGLTREEAADGLAWMGAGAGWALLGAMRGGGAMAGDALRKLSRPRSETLGEPEPIGAARREPAPTAPEVFDDEEPPLTAGAARAAEREAQTAEPEEVPAAPPSVLARLRAATSFAGPAQEDDEDAGPAMAPPPATPRPAPRAPVAPPAKRAPISRRARAEAQPTLDLDEFKDPEAYDHPPLTLLENPREIVRPQLSNEALEENARMLEAVLDDYGIRGEIVKVSPGPVVTMYELEPERGVKASRVIGLADDIARSMSALAARVSTVPGRSIIGIELPNDAREKVLLREIFEARAFGDAREKLLLALGKDIAGEPVVANLARMPHLLIAGTTGSGKSVAINTMILSLLYRLSPKECRMIMIDPKMLELSVYDGIPHLLSPVVTDPKKAVVALKWVVAEMEERYRKMSRMGVRNIEGYNSRVRDALEKEEDFTRTVQTGFCEETGEPVFETQSFEPEEMPFIVVVVDEMADLMMVAGKEIEACIQRLAQMARASGIHLIMATQRPSVDVITGTIKANFPTRISFQVTSKIDSRTILGEQGAEQLLGMGDMLHMAGGGRVSRVHGPFVSDEEVEEIVCHLKSLGEPEYVGGVTEGPDEEQASEIDLVLGLGDGGDDSEAALYDRAVAIVARDRKCSTSYIQRKLSIGYQRAARLVEQMEEQGVVTPANKVGKREILVGEV